MLAESALRRDPEQDGLSRARGLGLGVLLSALIWCLLAVIKLTLW